MISVLPRSSRSRRSTNTSRRTKFEGRRPNKLFVEPLEHRRLLAAYDISTGPGVSTPSINGAIFQATNPDSSAGTGTIMSFLRVQKTGTEQGFNTDAGVTLDAKGGSFTRSLLLSDVPLVVRPQDGVLSQQFALDINQSDPLISLDQVKIYLTNNPNLTEAQGNPAAFHNFATPIPAGTAVVPVYDLDAGGDNYIKMSQDIGGSGSGRLDALMYIPKTQFDAALAMLPAGSTPYVVLYCQFGTEFATDGGFEEWSVGEQRPLTATIEGFKFNDLNGNGVFNPGEPRLNGVTIYLDANGNNMLDPGEVSQVTHTEIVNGVSYDGLYEFEGLLPGTYKVREVVPPGST